MESSFLDKMRTISVNIIIFLLPVISLFFLLPYILKIAFPFIIAVVLVIAAAPIRNFLLKKGFPKTLGALLSLIFITALFVFFFWLVFSRIIKEFYGFSENFSVFQESFSQSFLKISQKLSAMGRGVVHLSPFSDNAASIIDSFGDSLKDQLSVIISSVTAFIINIAKNLPSALISVFTAFLSAFFILKDKEKLSLFLMNFIGKKNCDYIYKAKAALCGAVGKYIKAQLIIGLIMFCVLLSGFLVLRVNYAFLFALLTAVVDAVPVFGTGTILIPWAVINIFSNNSSLGWGLITLYGVCVLTRQICEPKIVGAHLGIHPLVSIFSIYAGMQLFGIFGFLLGPLTALLIKALIFPK